MQYEELMNGNKGNTWLANWEALRRRKCLEWQGRWISTGNSGLPGMSTIPGGWGGLGPGPTPPGVCWAFAVGVAVVLVWVAEGVALGVLEVVPMKPIQTFPWLYWSVFNDQHTSRRLRRRGETHWWKPGEHSVSVVPKHCWSAASWKEGLQGLL